LSASCGKSQNTPLLAAGFFTFSRKGARKLWGQDWNGQAMTIYFGHANDPDRLEAATNKAT
jgi:hypothetical protein